MPYERKTVDLFISEELKELLLSIKDESLVAKMLLNKRPSKEDMVKNHVNYISISKQDKSKISYLTVDRISAINESEYWTSPRRYQAKPGSFISKLFSSIPPKEVEKFSSLFKTIALKPDFTFKVVSGNDIKKYYHYDSYANDRGSLGISCMKYENCQRLFNIYLESKDVSMLVMLDSDNMLMGRALLWNTTPEKVMDRIYTIDDETLRFYFKKWATDNGYWYKTEQNWYNTLQFEQVGSEKVELKLEVKLDKFRLYPYMDTFKFIDVNDNTIFNYIPEGRTIKTLVACDGSKYDSDYLKFDDIDRIFRYKSESVFIEYLNIYTHQNNARWSRLNEKYILERDSVYDEKIDDYLFKDDSLNKERPKPVKLKRKSGLTQFSDVEMRDSFSLYLRRTMQGYDSYRVRHDGSEQPIDDDSIINRLMHFSNMQESDNNNE